MFPAEVTISLHCGVLQDKVWQEPSLARVHQLMSDLTQLAAEAGLQSASKKWEDIMPSSAETAELHLSCQDPTNSGDPTAIIVSPL